MEKPSRPGNLAGDSFDDSGDPNEKLRLDALVAHGKPPTRLQVCRDVVSLVLGIAVILVVAAWTQHQPLLGEIFGGWAGAALVFSIPGIGAAVAGTLGLMDDVRLRTPRLKHPYPAAVSRADRTYLDQLARAYGDYQRAIAIVPDGPARQRIQRILTSSPGDDALQIVTSRAWSDPWLADHRLDIAPLHEATEIYEYLLRIAENVTEFHRKAERLADAPEAATYRDYIENLTGDLTAVQRRIEALAGYATQIAELSRLLYSQELLPQIERDTDRVLNLQSESRRHELAAEHIDRQRRDLLHLEQGLREIQTLLTTDPGSQLPTRLHQ